MATRTHHRMTQLSTTPLTTSSDPNDLDGLDLLLIRLQIGSIN